MSKTLKAVVVVLLLSSSASVANAANMRDIVGASHIGGRYSFNLPWPVPAGDTNRRDDLNEGADEIYNMGSRVIKLWFHPTGKAWYWYTYNPEFSNAPYGFSPEYRLAETAKQEQWTRLFDKPFTTFVLNVMSNVPHPNGTGGENYQQFGGYATMLDGLTATERATEKAAIKNLAIWLYNRYRYSGKTFVIQNWEGDWIMRDGLADGVEPTQTRINNMIAWVNARQEGVNEARAMFPDATMKVVHAFEVNRVTDAYNNATRTATNDIVPYTNCDLYSYSAWDLWDNGHDGGAAVLHRNLEHIASKAPDSTLYGRFNLYLGEFGFAENTDAAGDGQKQQRIIRRHIEAALGWGVRYALYWTVYCNGLQNGVNLTMDQRPTNSQMVGLWLVRPDGSKTPLYYHLQSIMNQGVHHVAMQASSGYHVSPDEGGGYAIRAGAPWISTWEYLTIIDRNGGSLLNNDPVNVLTWKGNYFMAYNNGGGYLDATATEALTWEQFTIKKLNGTTGTIGIGTPIALQAGSGHYAYVQNGGGPGDLFFGASSTAVGSWETFTLRSMNW